ncbi:MAG: hypothetical protein ACR2Q3_01610 [Woeseiaceae bacterium]
MKITALDNFTATWWEPPGQDPGEAVGFQLRPLDGEQYAEVAQYVLTLDDQVRFSHQAMVAALKYGLVGWRGFKTAAGAELEHLVSNHKLIPFEVRSQIFGEILGLSNLDEAQEKNLSSQLKLQKTGSDSIA